MKRFQVEIFGGRPSSRAVRSLEADVPMDFSAVVEHDGGRGEGEVTLIRAPNGWTPAACRRLDETDLTPWVHGWTLRELLRQFPADREAILAELARGPVTSCPRCQSADVVPLRNYGRPIVGDADGTSRWHCLACGRRFDGPEVRR